MIIGLQNLSKNVIIMFYFELSKQPKSKELVCFRLQQVSNMIQSSMFQSNSQTLLVEVAVH